MIGTQVERQGIIRAGAKMISAVSEATVPKFSVIIRKAYGAGLYAMAGPAFDPDACIALPGAKIAVMGPQAAINAVYYNQVQAIEDETERAAFVDKLRREFSEEIDVLHLASELVVDAVIQPEDLRAELVRRLELCGHQGPLLAGEAQRGHAGLAPGLPGRDARQIALQAAGVRQPEPPEQRRLRPFDRVFGMRQHLLAVFRQLELAPTPVPVERQQIDELQVAQLPRRLRHRGAIDAQALGHRDLRHRLEPAD